MSSLFLQDLFCNTPGSWARTTGQTPLWPVDASYNWNQVSEDLHGGEEINILAPTGSLVSSSEAAVYSHDSHQLVLC